MVMLKRHSWAKKLLPILTKGPAEGLQARQHTTNQPTICLQGRGCHLRVLLQLKKTPHQKGAFTTLTQEVKNFLAPAIITNPCLLPHW